MEGSRELDPSAVLVHRVARATRALGGTPTASWSDESWESAETVSLDHWTWPEPGPEVADHPAVHARTLYDEHFLAIQFRVRGDRGVRCQHTKWCEQVCNDACCEFFVAPFAESGAATPYFNFEINAAGTALVYSCTPDRRVELAREDASRIKVAASLSPERGPTAAADGAALDRRDVETEYCVEYHVPWALFAKYHGVAAPEAGARWRGNFYKCGDDTGRPHWGTWAPVGTNRPNFHRPSDFQVLTFA